MTRTASSTFPALIGVTLAFSACSPVEDDGATAVSASSHAQQDNATTTPTEQQSHDARMQATMSNEFTQRLAAIDTTVSEWETADTIAAAHRAAETARNLVVGPNGPYYGDGDKDGTIAGVNAEGLLPGLAGQPGLASANPNDCVQRDLLGGSWADPAARWSTAKTAITNWSKTNNTFPSLPSHPQRIVGWSTLTLATDDLATAREYGSHARIHIDVASRAANNCR